jgi:hypothetical protein
VIVDRIQRTFSPNELRERARAANLAEQERKFDFVALFYTLSLGFVAGSDRSIQAFLERFVETAECDELVYSSFTNWFSPAFVATLRAILDDAIENLDPERNELRGRLSRFRDVLVVDAAFISLYQDAKDVYTATGDGEAGLKLHITESLATGLPTRYQTTERTTQERSQLPTGEWVAGALILFDLHSTISGYSTALIPMAAGLSLV